MIRGRIRMMASAAMAAVMIVIMAAGPTLAATEQTRTIKRVIRDDQGRELGTYTGSYALLVAAHDYRAWPNLESVPGEMDEVADALAGRGFEVTRISNPRSRELRNAFEAFIGQHGFDKDNRLLFFFSGHGHTRLGGRKGYLVPVDAPDPRKDERGFLRKAVSMSQVLAWARRIESNHALFLFDSCFSGTVFEAKALPDHPPHINDYISRPVRQFITAGSAGEEVPARSRFTPSFIRAIRGQGDLNRDGYVTGTELGMFLHDRVLHYRTGQTPQYGKILDPDLDEGDFVFILDEPDDRSRLSVESNVTDAWVRLDGNGIGRTPLTDAPVEPGDYRLSVGKDDYETERRTISIDKGRHSRIFVHLKPDEPETARLFVHAEPSGARVRILNIGPAFRQGMELTPGRYEVEASADGCATRTRWVTVSAGRDEYVDMVLKCGGPGPDRFTNSIGMEFVRIPAGSFMMGSPEDEPGRDDDEKQHRVTLTRVFFMGTTEVTVSQWKAFVDATGYRTEAEKGDGAYVWTGKWEKKADANWRNPYFEQTDRHPVTCVSWNDAREFIDWLSRKDGRAYRLPTEAEWEYAARAGTTTPFTYGRCLSTNQANYNGNYPLDGCGKGEYRERTIPVGSLNAPNAWGLHDMHGNVWEWCQDRYGDYPSGSVTDPTGPSSGKYRVLRGGGWINIARYCRSAYRIRHTADYRYGNYGFRLVSPPGQ